MTKRVPFGAIKNPLPVDLARIRMSDPIPEIGPVEEGIEVPPRPGKQPGAVAQAVYALLPGQSRRFDKITGKALYHTAKVARNKGFGQEYAVREEGDGYRVWRLK